MREKEKFRRNFTLTKSKFSHLETHDNNKAKKGE